MYITEFITKHILLLKFSNQKDITSTMLRFQEHYESPEFKGKVFTLKKYKEWYIKNSANGKQANRFTYYEDWNGFNVPDYIFDPFIKGQFNPLSKKEKMILQTVSKLEKPYYVIAVHDSDDLQHEIQHGLFYTDSGYRTEMMDELSKHYLESQTNLLLYNGYHPDVIQDELHAYVEWLPSELRDSINSIYNRYIRKLRVGEF